MAARVELLVQLCINGRPIWIKSGMTKSENTLRMTDKEYERVVQAAVRELTLQINSFKKEQEAVK